MRFESRIRTLSTSAVAMALLLSACGGPDAEETATPSPPVEASAPVEPTEAVTSEEARPSEVVPEETPEPVPSSTRTGVATGVLEGEELNAAGVAWFDVVCSGATEASSFAQTTEPGMTGEEVVEAAVTTYQMMGTSVTATADRLGALDTAMNFENADAFAEEVRDIFYEVGQLMWDGTETVKTETFRNEEEFGTTIAEIEGSIMDAGGFDFGVSGLDPTITEAVSGQVPSCGSL